MEKYQISINADDHDHDDYGEDNGDNDDDQESTTSFANLLGEIGSAHVTDQHQRESLLVDLLNNCVNHKSSQSFCILKA